MKLERKHRQLIVLGIAVIIILIGLVQAIFKLELNKKVVDEITFILMIIAFALLFGNKKAPKPSNDQITPAEDGNEATEDVAEDKEKEI